MACFIKVKTKMYRKEYSEKEEIYESLGIDTEDNIECFDDYSYVNPEHIESFYHYDENHTKVITLNGIYLACYPLKEFAEIIDICCEVMDADEIC